MKIRDSGMPERGYWETFFDPERVLDAMQLDPSCGDVVEFGCGYGTFTLPAARRIGGTLHTFDLDPAMIETTRQRAREQHIGNIVAVRRDFVQHGTGLADGAADYAMLFNVLHLEDPVPLLGEARRNLFPGGRLAVIHWRFGADTPRGPPLEIRPKPEQCLAWAGEAGFVPAGGIVDLPPYHYGILLLC